jgi:hypothetical protein
MTKCKICKSKIQKLFVKTMYTCRCKNIYCAAHINNHKCTFDYKKLEEKKTQFISEKVIKI